MSLIPFICNAAPFGVTQGLHFLENVGQVTDQYGQVRRDIDFKVSTPGLNIFISDGAIHYQFSGRQSESGVRDMYRMDVELVGADKGAKYKAEGKDTYYEYHYNAGATDRVYSYSKVTYYNVYPFIDWVLYIKDNAMEYEFLVHKGGDPSQIRLRYAGADNLSIDTEGKLVASTPMGKITENAPISFQRDGSGIASAFALDGDTVGFKLADWKGELTIDPKLEWSTYFGGEGIDNGYAVACDDSGYVYMAGGTNSVNNIATIGSHQASYNGGSGDAVLAKFDGQGNKVWCTYYGGGGGDGDISVACDKYHSIYLSGVTTSSWGISTPGSHQEVTSTTTNTEGFLVRFNNEGTRLWGTYYGGDSVDKVYRLACDDSGNVYMVGNTNSITGISTPGTHRSQYIAGSAASDAFLVKFDSLGVRQWGTYYGGTAGDAAYGVATDALCNVYIIGGTSSIDSVAVVGAHQETNNGSGEAFIAKFNNSGQRVWGTYYGGTANDDGTSIVVDADRLYVSGQANSTNNIATPGSHQPSLVGFTDIFLARFDTAGNRIWGTYYGGLPGSGGQGRNGNQIAVDNSGDVYLYDVTSSITNISSANVPQEIYGGGQFDVFLAKFNPSGTRLWGTYFGTCSLEIDGGCAVDNIGNIFITGFTNSNDMATPGAYQMLKDGTHDAFLAKFNNDDFGISGDTQICDGDMVTYFAAHVPGATSYTWTLPNGWTGSSTVDTINVVAGATSGTVSVVANKDCSTEPAQAIGVTVHPLPVPVITLSGNTLSTTTTFVSYQWYDNNGAIAGATSQSYTASAPGEYYVVVTDANGCTGQSNSIVGITSIEKNGFVALYPNPNNGEFMLNASDIVGGGEAVVEIVDMMGRLLFTDQVPVTSGRIEKKIDIKSAISSGSYLLRLTVNGQKQTILFSKY